MSNIQEPLDTLPTLENSPNPKDAKPKKKRIRRILRYFFITAGACLALLIAAVIGAAVFLRSNSGEEWLTRQSNSLLQSLPSGLSVSIDSVTGPIPGRLSLKNIAVRDTRGECIKIDEVLLSIDWSALLKTFSLEELSVINPVVKRIPAVLPSQEEKAPEEVQPSLSPYEQVQNLKRFLAEWPGWLPHLLIKKIALSHLRLEQPVLNMPCTLSLEASARASRSGIGSRIKIQREDMPCPESVFAASFGSDGIFSVDALAGDMGFASLIPSIPRDTLALLLQVKASGPVEKLPIDIKTSLLSADLKKYTFDAPFILNFDSRSLLQLSSKGMDADSDLVLKTGSDVSKLWGLLGINKGKVDLSLHASASLADDLALAGRSSLKFSGMDWGVPQINQTFGKDPSCAFDIDLTRSNDGMISMLLNDMHVDAPLVKASLLGKLKFNQDLSADQPDSRIDVQSNLDIKKLEGISPAASGDLRSKITMNGSLASFNTDLRASSSVLSSGRYTLKDTSCTVSLPHINITELAKTIPLALQRAQSALEQTSPGMPGDGITKDKTLLSGDCTLASTVNGQKISFSSKWELEEKNNGLRFALEKLGFNADKTDIRGMLSAVLPYSAQPPSKGSIAELAGLPLPDLNGSLDIHVDQWKALRDITGLRLSGSPLDLKVKLDPKNGQRLTVKGEMPKFALQQPDNSLSIEGFKADITGEQLWDLPVFSMQTGLQHLKTGDLVLDASSLDLSGKFLKSGEAGSEAISWFSAKADVQNKALQMGDKRLLDTTFSFSLPKADLARMMRSLPMVLQRTQNALGKSADGPSQSTEGDMDLLSGDCALSSTFNGQDIAFRSKWNIEEKDNGLRFAMEQLGLSAEQTDIRGVLSAFLPYSCTPPEKGSIADLAGMTMPDINGSLDIRVEKWDALSHITGLGLAGSPLDLQIKLDGKNGQSLSLKGSMPDFTLKQPGNSLSVHGLQADITGKQLWDFPAIDVHTSVSDLKAGDIHMDTTQASFSGIFLKAGSGGTDAASLLRAEAAVENTSLQLADKRLRDTSLHLSLPKADLAHLLQTLPMVLQRTQDALANNAVPPVKTAAQDTDLLSGDCDLTSTVNGQNISFRSKWDLEEKDNGLRFALEELGFNADQTGVEGMLSAVLPYSSPAPAKGSMAELAGIPLPELNGSLNVRVDQWKALSDISGLKLSGSPLDLRIKLDRKNGQCLSVIGNMPKFSLASPGNPLSVSGFKADITGEQLWDFPAIDLQASVQNIKSGELLLDASQASFTGKFLKDGSGDNEALSWFSADASVENKALQMGDKRLQDTSFRLSLPKANLAQLLQALPMVLQRTQKALENSAGQPPMSPSDDARLLSGDCALASTVNGQKVSFNSKWDLEEKDNGLRFAMEKLDLSAYKTGITGVLSAVLPYSAPPPEKGSIAEMAGMPLPHLLGSLDIHVDQWKPLADITGLKFSGSPLDIKIDLNQKEGQSLSVQGNLSQFSLAQDSDTMQINGLTTEISGRDLWGKPSVAMQVFLSGFKTKQLSIQNTTLKTRSTMQNASASLNSSGDVQTDMLINWEPGKLIIQRLSAKVSPALLSLQGSEPLGLQTEKAVSLLYKNDEVSVPSLNAALLPAGNLSCTASYSPKSMKVTSSLKNFDLKRYQALIPEMPGGMIDLSLNLSGSPMAPKGNFHVDLKDISASESIPPLTSTIKGTLEEKRGQRGLDIAVLLSDGTKKVLGLKQADIAMSVPFTRPASGVSMPDLNGSIRADVIIKGALDKLWKLLPMPDQRLNGGLELDAKVYGKASSPSLDAKMLLKDGRFLDIAQGIELRNLQADISAHDLKPVEQSGRAIVKFSGKDTRKGTMGLDGNIDLASKKININGDLKSLSPLHRQDVSIMLSGKLGVSGSLESPLIHADITVDKGRVQLAKLPGGDITEIEIHDPQKEKESQGSSSPGKIDVHVNIPNQFFIQGYGLDCEWKGDIYAKGSLTKPSVTGGLQAVRGTLDILGKNFKLAEGEVKLDGGWPISPLLNIDMEYQASNITADIIVEGTASNPKLNLTSKPVLPNDEILSQVLFGQSTGSLSHLQALQLASATATLAGFGDADVLGKSRKALGVDVLKLNSDNDGDSSDVSKTSLEMGTYVRDNIYVGMDQGVGKNNETGAVVEIELFPGLDVQAKNYSTKSEIGLKWKKNY